MGFDISATPEWAALRAHVNELRKVHLRELFASDLDRADRFIMKVGDLTVDWSRHLVTDRTHELLLGLARRAGVTERIAAMLKGEPVNATESRPALHTALRAPMPVAGGRKTPRSLHAVRPSEVSAELERVAEFAHALRSGERLGCTGKPISAIVNLGIGGSHLGPAMAHEALAAFRHTRLKCHFVSNVDPAGLSAALDGLDPAATLFVVVSKSFTTAETLANTRAARDWTTAALGPESTCAHFAAVTGAPDVAAELGITPDNTFAMWDWVGGRYSLASAAGLALVAAVGFKAFSRMLAGMRAMDEHLASRPLHANAPVLMGLLAVWYRNFWGFQSRAVLPYSHRLRWLPTYLRQLEMESNGKRVRIDGRAVSYDTGPIVWGGRGTDGQHSFYQMLHQGTTVVPADFIVFASADPDITPLADSAHRHDILMANCLAQAAAMAFGNIEPTMASHQRGAPSGSGDGSKPLPDGSDIESAAESGSHQELPGNRPSTLIIAPQLTPSVLGQLVALYEHQVAVQGAVWGINSFDQFGVEHGKRLAESVLSALRDPQFLENASPAHPQRVQTASSVHSHGNSRYDPATLASLGRIARLRQSS